MKPIFRASIFLVSAAIVFAAAGFASSASYEVMFRAGLDARSFEKWGEAIAFFGEAVEVRSRESEEPVLWYGTWWVEYRPHLYLGEALYQVGRYRPAFEEYALSMSQLELPRTARKLVGRDVEAFPDICKRRRGALRERLTRSVGVVREIQNGLDALAERGGRTDDLRDTVVRGASELVRARGDLGEVGGPSGCAAASNARGLAGRVNASAELAGALESVETRVDRLAADLSLVEQETRNRRRGLAERKATSTIEKLESLLARGEGGAVPRLLSQGPTPVRATTGRLTDEERAIERYLVALARIADGRCRETRELLGGTLAVLPPASGATVHPRIPHQPHLDLARAARNCGDRDGAVRHLAAAAEAGEAPERDLREIERWLEDSRPLGLYSEKYALLIGGVGYTGELESLPAVRDDLAEVARVLERMGFAMPLGGPLIDLPKEELEETIVRFLRDYGKDPRTALLLYWAGHGETLRNAHDFPTGYILPVGMPPLPDDSAVALDLLRDHAIDVETFHLWANGDAKNALHTLFVFDSCHSGTVLNDLKMDLQSFDRQRIGQPVRMFVASGTAREEVPADSRFRHAFVRGIQGCADRDGNGHVTGTELGDHLRQAMTDPTPQAGKSRSREYSVGDFVFDGVAKGSDDCDLFAPGRRHETILGDLDLEEVLEEVRVWENLVARIDQQDLPPEVLDIALRIYTDAYPEPYFGVVVERIRARLAGAPATPSAARTSVASR